MQSGLREEAQCHIVVVGSLRNSKYVLSMHARLIPV
jgi:hypothetical protein